MSCEKKVGIYIGEDYPNEITLNYSESRTILSKPTKVTPIPPISQMNQAENKIRVIRDIREK